MKFLKTFEEKQNGEYWRIDCTSLTHIKLALLKIGVTPNEQIFNDILDDPNIDSNRENYMTHFYIMKGLTIHGEVYWFYSFNNKQFQGRYKYNGKVKITDLEVKADKYNI